MSRQASGLKAWLIQRLSAVYLGLFGSYMLLRLALAPPTEHAVLLTWMASGPVALGGLVFIGLLLAHTWVGLRDVLIDYVKPPALRLGLLTLVALLLLGCGLWGFQTVLMARTLALTAGLTG